MPNPNKPYLRHRILIFFASCPEAKMTREELTKKFDCSLRAVDEATERWIKNGILAWCPRPREPGLRGASIHEYVAGPELLAELGEDVITLD